MKTLGINVTPTSVAIALLEEENFLETLVHHFPKAENPDGSSLSEVRRSARLARRQIKRRKWRRKAIVNLFKKHLDLTEEDICRLLGPKKISPWELRKGGLNRRLSDLELGIALYHIAKRRGFKSSRKEKLEIDVENPDKAKDVETKKAMLKGISELTNQLNLSGCLTVGEYLCGEPKKKNHPDSYVRTVTRDQILKEVSILLQKQRGFGNTKVSDLFEKEYLEALSWQAPIKSYVDKVGYCTLEPSEKRAAKHSYSAESFVALSKLANLKLVDEKFNKKDIDLKDKHSIFQLAHNQKEVTYNTIRKKLKIPSNYTFNLVTYRRTDKLSKKIAKELDAGKRDSEKATWEEIISDCESEVIFSLKGYHTLKSTISSIDSKYWDSLKPYMLDDIASIISFYPDEYELETELKKLQIPGNIIDALIPLDFSQTLNLSLKATRKIIPLLNQGLTYNDAISKLGYNKEIKKQETSSKLSIFEQTTNPVVNRALSKTRKIVNAIIAKHGMPDNIHIELANDLPKSAKQKKDILRRQKKKEEYNKTVFKEAEGFFNRKPTSIELEKYKLWLDQGKLSFYSGRVIDERHLLDPTMTEIDYIIPFSRSFDNSRNNKVLCFTTENQNKSNKTAYEMYGNGDYWEGIQSRAKDLASRSKTHRILIENFDDRLERMWQDRYLNDTRYIARLLKEQLLSLNLAGSIHVRNSAVIEYLKSIWGLRIINDYRSHCIDAICIAVCTDDMMKKICKYNKYKEYLEKAKGIKEPPKPEVPWDTFHNDVLTRLDNIFVTRSPVGKMTGLGHADTILGIRWKGSEFDVVKRIPLDSLTLKNVDRIVNRSTSNKGLYEMLKKRLTDNLNDKGEVNIKKAFPPEQVIEYGGKIIRKIRIYDNRSRGVFVRKGLAHNKENLRRVDLFRYKNKIYPRVVYTYDAAKRKLPEYCENLDVKIDDSFTFLCSLYKNDYIEILNLKGEIHTGYFAGIQPVNGNIRVLQPNDGKEKGVNISTIKNIDKFHIDFFGNKSLIRQKKPEDFT